MKVKIKREFKLELQPVSRILVSNYLFNSTLLAILIKHSRSTPGLVTGSIDEVQNNRHRVYYQSHVVNW